MVRPVLSYPFARQHGVIAVPQDDGSVTLAHRPSASRDALIEARRVVGVPVAREVLSPEAFEQKLSGLYAQADLAGASEDAMGAPQDLTALADGLPRTSEWAARLRATRRRPRSAWRARCGWGTRPSLHR